MSSTSLIDIVQLGWVNHNEGLTQTPSTQICGVGGDLLTDRLRYIATECCNRFPGDLVEIGCWEGFTTTALCEAAKRFGRKVIAIDPWTDERGRQGTFMGKMKPQMDSGLLEVHDKESQDSSVVAMLKSRPLCFVYVDGLHTYSAVKSDCAAVDHCQGIIVCDDISWNAGIRHAFIEVMTKIQLRHPYFREGYLIQP